MSDDGIRITPLENPEDHPVLGPPDFVVDPSERWECPCGGLKVGPMKGFAMLSSHFQCGCGNVVAFIPNEVT